MDHEVQTSTGSSRWSIEDNAHRRSERCPRTAGKDVWPRVGFSTESQPRRQEAYSEQQLRPHDVRISTSKRTTPDAGTKAATLVVKNRGDGRWTKR